MKSFSISQSNLVHADGEKGLFLFRLSHLQRTSLCSVISTCFEKSFFNPHRSSRENFVAIPHLIARVKRGASPYSQHLSFSETTIGTKCWRFKSSPLSSLYTTGFLRANIYIIRTSVIICVILFLRADRDIRRCGRN